MTTGVFDFSPAGYEPPAVMWTGTMVFLPPHNIGPTVMAALGPDGGVIMMDAAPQGPAGTSPTLRNVNLTQVAYNASAAGSWVEPSAGVWDLDLSLPAGTPGDVLGFILQEAQDIFGGAGALVHQAQLLFDGVLDQFIPSELKVGGWFNVVGIAPTPSTAGQTRTLASRQIPAYPFDWQPIVCATSMVTGTVNTHVDLVARLDGPTGLEIARGPGQVGAVTGSNPFFTYLIPTLGPSLQPIVTKGNGATIYLNAEAQGNTIDTYSTDATLYSVGVWPVSN